MERWNLSAFGLCLLMWENMFFFQMFVASFISWENRWHNRFAKFMAIVNGIDVNKTSSVGFVVITQFIIHSGFFFGVPLVWPQALCEQHFRVIRMHAAWKWANTSRTYSYRSIECVHTTALHAHDGPIFMFPFILFEPTFILYKSVYIVVVIGNKCVRRFPVIFAMVTVARANNTKKHVHTKFRFYHNFIAQLLLHCRKHDCQYFVSWVLRIFFGRRSWCSLLSAVEFSGENFAENGKKNMK